MKEGRLDTGGTHWWTALDRKLVSQGAIPPIALMATLAIGLSACGGGSPQTSGIANLGATTSTSAASSHPSLIKFSECMRAHGIANFPDPKPTGSIAFNAQSGVNPQSSQFQAAQRACKKYNPRASTTLKPAGPSKAVLIKYAKCMRAHGVANFPDPVPFPGGTWGFELVGQVNQTSPSFQAANQACMSHAYGGIHPCGNAGGGSRRSSSQERRC